MAFKVWADAEVVDADEFNDYIQEQVVMEFASTAARDAALTSVKTEGMLTYQADTDEFTFYTGTVWKDLALGLADGSITDTQLDTDSVTTIKIADLNVTLAKMAANSVDSDQYVDGSIDTDHIGALQVTTPLIANSAVTADQLGTGAVTNTKIGTNAVSNTKIGALAVDEAELASNSVSKVKMQDDAVGNNEIDGTDSFVTTGYWEGSEFRCDASGSAANVHFGPGSDPNTGLYMPSADLWRLAAGGNDIFSGDGAANRAYIGVGTGCAIYAPQLYGDNTSGGFQLEIESNGHVYSIDSRRAHKKNIGPVTDEVLDGLRRIEVVEYDRRRNDRHELGGIAEQVAEQAPVFAVYDAEGEPASIDWRGIAFGALALVQRLEKRVEALEEAR